MNGTDTHCSAWLEIFKFIPHYWSNGDTNLSVIGLTDGQFSGRLAPFQSQEVEQALDDCGQYTEGSRHLIVGKLELDVVFCNNTSSGGSRLSNTAIAVQKGTSNDAIAMLKHLAGTTYA